MREFLNGDIKYEIIYKEIKLFYIKFCYIKCCCIFSMIRHLYKRKACFKSLYYKKRRDNICTCTTSYSFF